MSLFFHVMEHQPQRINLTAEEWLTRTRLSLTMAFHMLRGIMAVCCGDEQSGLILIAQQVLLQQQQQPYTGDTSNSLRLFTTHDTPHQLLMMAHKKSPVSHSITAFGSIMLMLAMFAGLWAVTSQSPRTKNVLTARSFYEQNNTAHILSARANDGNDRDPNWYPVSRQVIVDSNPRELDPRGLSIYKGIELLCKMEATLESTTNLQTQWPDWANLERYGWSTNIWPHDEDIRETIQLEDAFNDLGISIDPEDWYKLIQEHREESEVDGTTYPPTDGLYKNILNLKDGALIAENNASPAHVVGMRGELETTRMVPLKQWSDVVWLGIKQLTEALEEDDDNCKTPFQNSLGTQPR